MAVKERSFWSTTAGVVTGTTGFLTAVGGLLAIAVQLGWIGGDGGDNGGDGSSGQSTQTTAAGTTASTVNPLLGGGSGTNTGGTGAPQFSVTPTQVRFEQLGPRESLVTVKNSGSSAFTLQTPKIEGVNASMFTIAGNTCPSRLDAGRSCEIKVGFAPRGGGDFNAKLVVQVTGAPAQEVPLSGRALL